MPRLVKICALLVTICLMLSAAYANESKLSLVVATDLWGPHYTTEAGDGLYQRIVEQIYFDYQVSFVIGSYERSKKLVQEGKADLWLAAYLNEESWARFPHHPFDADEIVAVYQKQSFDESGSLDQFNGLDAAWVREHEYQQYLDDFDFRYYETDDLKTAFSMVLGGRVDVAICDIFYGHFVLKNLPELQHQLTWRTIRMLPLYPGFSESKRSVQLLQLWDKRITLMKRKGELQALYDEFEEPYLLADDGLQAHSSVQPWHVLSLPRHVCKECPP